DDAGGAGRDRAGGGAAGAIGRADGARTIGAGAPGCAEPEAAGMSRLIAVEIDDDALPPSAEMAQERRGAIFDLVEDNAFALPGRDGGRAPPGPFRLILAIRDRRLVFDIRAEDATSVAEFHLSLGPFRQVVKDYFQICESYFEAVKRLPPGQIE